MAKKPLLSFFVFALLFFNTNTARSQTVSDLEKEYENAFVEYQIAFDDYKNAREEYLLARSQYQRFQTLTSQNNARNATRAMLGSRDEVVVRYLESLRRKLLATETSEMEKKARLISQIDEEKNWFNGHKELLASASSLEDLIEDSNEAKARYDLMPAISYEVLSLSSYSRVVRLNERLESNFAETRILVNQIRDESRSEYRFDLEKLDRIDKWIFDTEAKIQRGNEKIQLSEESLNMFGSDQNRGSIPATSYQRIMNELTRSLQDMKDASLYTREIIKEVKTR